MKSISMLRIIVLSLALLVLSGCKLAVILVEGGEVQSTASGTCTVSATVPPSGNVCLHEVVDTSYSETFTAVADAGWVFVKWNTGGGFWCQNSTDPVCTLSLVDVAGVASVESIVASSDKFYIMPVFTEVELPNAITAGGKVWKQPVDFINLSWHDIDAVCPFASNGVCDGILNGIDMAGWTWASVADVLPLFNTYGTSLGGNGDIEVEFDSLWAPAFFNAGWQPTFVDSTERFLQGWLRDEGFFEDEGRDALMQQSLDGGSQDVAEVGGFRTKDFSFSQVGAWFYLTNP